jgi:hypothetical protein
MRTTLDLSDDVLMAAKELAKRQNRTAGQVISELARIGLRGPANANPHDNGLAEPPSFYGFVPIPSNGKIVTNEYINQLRDELGI